MSSKKRVEIIVTNPVTGEEIRYPSINDAANAIGCSTGNVAKACKGGYKCFGYKVRRGEVKYGSGKTNICFDCKKACGGCSWSEIDPETKKPRFRPVEGWTAKPVKLASAFVDGKLTYTDTYEISACPLFEPDEPRQTDFRMTPEKSVHFIENLDNYLRRCENV